MCIAFYSLEKHRNDFKFKMCSMVQNRQAVRVSCPISGTKIGQNRCSVLRPTVAPLCQVLPVTPSDVLFTIRDKVINHLHQGLWRG